MATAGAWAQNTINGMTYYVLLPDGYSTSVKYPVVLYLHQLDMGDDLQGLITEVNPWFNSADFRANHPSIVVMPLLDQTSDTSGQTINWGGLSAEDTAGEKNAIAALQQVMSTHSVDPSRIYITGNSMGGIGAWDLLIKYNAYAGTEGRIFAAGLVLAGADYAQGYPQPSASAVQALKQVPIWAIHGSQDTQVPLDWDRNLYAALKSSGKMIYTEDTSLGHDVWDTYYPRTGQGSPLGWLFQQSTSAASAAPPAATTAPTPAATPASSAPVVITPGQGSFKDAAGHTYTLSADGTAMMDGQPMQGGGGTGAMEFANGQVYGQDAKTQTWYLWNGSGWASASAPPSVTQPPHPSTPPVPTPTPAPSKTPDPTKTPVPSVSPSPTPKPSSTPAPSSTPHPSLTPAPSKTPSPSSTPVPPATPSPNNTVIAANGKTITDLNGNVWKIVNGQVEVNGKIDAATQNVNEMAFVDGRVWQENTSNLWRYKVLPTDQWLPAQGTSTSPLPTKRKPTMTISPLSGGASTVISGSDMSLAHPDGTFLSIKSSGVATIAFGTSDVRLICSAMSSVSIVSGTGHLVLVADSGENDFVVGSGDMDVTGGTGACRYEYNSNTGTLVVRDFSEAKGDTLEIASSLKSSMKASAGGAGGTKISFGTAPGEILLPTVEPAGMPNVKWV